MVQLPRGMTTFVGYPVALSGLLKRRTSHVKKALAARERAAKEKGELESGEPDVRVVDKHWVGALPNTRDLAGVLAKITDPEVVLNILRQDDRKTAPALYHNRLCEFEDLAAVLALVGDDDDLIIEMLGIDPRPTSEALYDKALAALGIDIS